jgi:bifunctional polynucleotide phosphatase/kinase
VEIVIFVGFPASGKTSFFRRHFQPAGYEHVNQDLLRTRDRCLARAEQLVKAGKKVVVDNTNRNVETRRYWVDLAEQLGVPIRLFHFLCPIELARHNNAYRVMYGPKDEPERELLPGTAFDGYKGQYEAPSVNEGFDEIRSVNFRWEGTDEQRRLWDMYMQ